MQCHPDTLASLASLVGLNPAPVATCRVLEVGCATGSNILPMALSLPKASFVGFDYSARQIEAAQAAAETVGLTNVRLLHLDIREVTPDLGEFDYIIAHGIYSWVPAEVRERLLALCQQNLAPNGLAFVSYNVYPGWHMLGTLRDMMLYHVRGIEDPRERAAEARSVLNFMAESVPTSQRARSSLLHAYSAFLQGEMKRLGPKADGFLLHDELEEVNDPVYFWQFMEQASQHGLEYVIDFDFRGSLPNHYDPKTAEAFIHKARNVVESEQYLDFLRSRSFRQTLLCHAGQTVQRTIGPRAWPGYTSLRAPCRPPRRPTCTSVRSKSSRRWTARCCLLTTRSAKRLSCIWPNNGRRPCRSTACWQPPGPGWREPDRRWHRGLKMSRCWR